MCSSSCCLDPISLDAGAGTFDPVPVIANVINGAC